ncbi:MAG: citrate transporter [Clostridiales bacterium GWF2_38_85]|nr:MAG: citrate transporter [Clostridiales bacterium GWF2_38_85]
MFTDKAVSYIKDQPVLFIAIIVTVLTVIVVPVDSTYKSYFDVRTLTCLFCTLAVVAAYKHIYLFEIIAQAIVIRLKNLRNVVIGVVFITYIASMLLANDMALLTFLPLGYLVLETTGMRKYIAFTFIMQNIAANLGGMLTPFGNPQNLYLFSYFNIPTDEFFRIMLVPFITAAVMILICCLAVKPIPMTLKVQTEQKLNIRKTIVYSLLFILSISIVFRLIPYLWGTIVITIVLMFLDRKAVAEVNYPLLLTFCLFFIFSGNMSRIPAIQEIFSNFLPEHTLITATISSQFISNVPSAVLLSRFTNDYASLLVAVNIGGIGTLVASLASLITFNEYKKHFNDTRKYILKFSAINFSFLTILVLVQVLINN